LTTNPAYGVHTGCCNTDETLTGKKQGLTPNYKLNPVHLTPVTNKPDYQQAATFLQPIKDTPITYPKLEISLELAMKRKRPD